jgi:predicted RND superfamily exporter protein
LQTALRSTAHKAGLPLALAAAATAVGFFSFLPTSYEGLSELGLIAGCGMLIAFMCSITFVPAMLAALNPPGEPASVGFAALAPLDDFLQRHRIAVIAVTMITVLAGVPLLFQIPFDFNPVNLQNPASASVKTIANCRTSQKPAAQPYSCIFARSGRHFKTPRACRSSRTLTLNNPFRAIRMPRSLHQPSAQVWTLR